MVEVEGEGISVWCRLRSGWGGPRCVVGLGVGWSWRWTGERKKQILLAQYARRRRGPRCARHGGQARNDNSRGFRQALRRVEGVR